MPQPKTPASSAAPKRRTAAAKPKPAAAAKKPAARTTAASKATTAAKPKATATRKPASRAAAAKPAAKATTAKATTAKPAAKPAAKTAAAKPAARRAPARKPAAPTPAAKPAAAPKAAGGPAAPAKREADPVAQLVGALRDQLSDRVFEPLNLVLLAAERIQESIDEAVERGRMTRGDANDLVGDLMRRGREQTDDVLGNLDELLGKGMEQIGQLSRRLEGKAAKARRADSVDRLMRSADRARRAVGVGPAFPILGYDDLSAPKVAERLADLKPAELRKVRDYETRHANRKSVLAAIDKALKA